MVLSDNFAAHIIRDVFHPHDGVVIYSPVHGLVETLRTPEHGIEAWRLYTSGVTQTCENAFNWPIEHNNPYFGMDFCNLFYAVDQYNPFVPMDPVRCALQVARFMREDGIVVAQGDPFWASKLSHVLRPRIDLEDELKRFGVFTSHVQVFQKR